MKIDGNPVRQELIQLIYFVTMISAGFIVPKSLWLLAVRSLVVFALNFVHNNLFKILTLKIVSKII